LGVSTEYVVLGLGEAALRALAKRRPRSRSGSNGALLIGYMLCLAVSLAAAVSSFLDAAVCKMATHISKHGAGGCAARRKRSSKKRTSSRACSGRRR
jgi:hypothetical protein